MTLVRVVQDVTIDIVFAANNQILQQAIGLLHFQGRMPGAWLTVSAEGSSGGCHNQSHKQESEPTRNHIVLPQSEQEFAFAGVGANTHGEVFS